MDYIVTLKVDQSKLDEMKAFYVDDLIENNGEYIYFMAKVAHVVITGYSSKKSVKTITFSGKGAINEARIWDPEAKMTFYKNKEKEEWIVFSDQIGSDEVGVGDLCLPMVVVAAYVKENDIDRLKELGIHDSKKMDDNTIRELGPTLIKEFKCKRLILSNEEYNKQLLNKENINSMKTKMHNKVLYDLHKLYPTTPIYIDEFVNEKKYYSYLDSSKPIVKNITFKTKGESSFPCVALASVIARYSFLLEKDKLETQYQMAFPCGAGVQVDKFVKTFIKKYSKEELSKIVKANFANVKDIL